MLGMTLASRLSEHWWVLLIRGLIAVAFGILIVLYPLASIVAFVYLFGAFAFVDGLFVVIAALRMAHPDQGRWWWMLLQGVVGIAIGVITVFYPSITAVTLAYLIAIWAIVTGILEVMAGMQMRQNVSGEILLILAGLLSIVLGVAFFILPGAALLTYVWVVSVYAVVAGIMLIALSFRLKGLGAQAKPA